MFFLFKIFKKLENLFFEEPKDYLLQTRFGKILKKIPGLKNFYRAEHNFSNWLYYKLKPKGVTLINVQGNKMYVNTEDTIGRILLIDRVMEIYTTKLFEKMIKKNMTVIDIGAHIGYFTLLLAKLVGTNGTVYAFEPQVDLATRTLKLRAQSPNKDRRFLPGMFVKIRFILEVTEDALLVPAESVIPELSGYKVFIVGADGNAEQRNVEIGTRTDTQVQVLSGLDEGDLVLTTGVMQVRQGMPLQPTQIN